MLSPAFLEELWYGNHPVSVLLSPLGWLYGLLMRFRNVAYRSGLMPSRRVSVPVIVVGNITVGGTGKTPLVIWLANYLKGKGFNPGIVSRGYGGRAKTWPQQVRPDSDPVMVGDEPVLIARRSNCPVAAAPDRFAAARGLLEHNHCDILISDDGLQHLALSRNLELCVIDGARRLGNGRCFPAGPLREPQVRLETVDMVVASGRPERGEFAMKVRPDKLYTLDNSRSVFLSQYTGHTVHAIAGIGNPARFFDLLKEFDINAVKHVFPDHHAYTETEINFNDDLPVIMTEKDAVKCMMLKSDRHWYLPVEAEVDDVFQYRINKFLQDMTDGQETA